AFGKLEGSERRIPFVSLPHPPPKRRRGATRVRAARFSTTTRGDSSQVRSTSWVVVQFGGADIPVCGHFRQTRISAPPNCTTTTSCTCLPIVVGSFTLPVHEQPHAALERRRTGRSARCRAAFAAGLR